MPTPCHLIAASTPREATPITTSWNDAPVLSKRQVPLAGLLSLGVLLSHSLSRIMTIRAIPTTVALQPEVFSSLPVPLQLVSAPHRLIFFHVLTSTLPSSRISVCPHGLQRRQHAAGPRKHDTVVRALGTRQSQLAHVPSHA